MKTQRQYVLERSEEGDALFARAHTDQLASWVTEQITTLKPPNMA